MSSLVSVCPIGHILKITYQGCSTDMASVHFSASAQVFSDIWYYCAGVLHGKRTAPLIPSVVEEHESDDEEDYQYAGQCK